MVLGHCLGIHVLGGHVPIVSNEVAVHGWIASRDHEDIDPIKALCLVFNMGQEESDFLRLFVKIFSGVEQCCGLVMLLGVCNIHPIQYVIISAWSQSEGWLSRCCLCLLLQLLRPYRCCLIWGVTFILALY